MASSAGASTAQLYRSFISLARRWPADPLRPELSFSASLRAAAHRAFLQRPPDASRVHAAGAKGSKKPLHEALEGVDDEALSQGQGALKSLSQEEVKYAEKALGSLDAILKGQAAKQFPTPGNILHPASHPNYYTRLTQSMERVAQGKNVTPSLSERIAIFFGKKI